MVVVGGGVGNWGDCCSGAAEQCVTEIDICGGFGHGVTKVVVGVALGVVTKNAIVRLVASLNEVVVDRGCNCDVG